jgi:hypothetical protein
MVNVVDQLLLHFARAIRVHCLFNRIAEPVLILDWVDRSIAAFDIFTVTTVDNIICSVAIGIA